jgi:hypothetical protein
MAERARDARRRDRDVRGGSRLYARATRAVDRTGTWAYVGLVAFLAAAYVGNVLGPPPRSANAVAGSALALWLIPLWGLWIERHRRAKPA